MDSQLTRARVGFLGAGAMAEALAGGLVAAGVPATRILASDPALKRREAVTRALGILATAENREVVEGSDLVVLAVKPAQIDGVLSDLAATPANRSQPLWISIAAGIPLARLAKGLPEDARIIRVMPNTPSLVGAGAAALAFNARVTDADRGVARALFETVGSVWEAPSEDLLDAVTGLSGSGPAYVFVFLEALAEAGVKAGLPAEASRDLALQTVYGAAKLALETGTPPPTLKDRVTSPGGTTQAGLAALEASGFRIGLEQAVAAATRRSRELAAS